MKSAKVLLAYFVATSVVSAFPVHRVGHNQAPTPAVHTPRVLVTGFHDWDNLGRPPNTWRCGDNPSCRLILGPASSSPPIARNGPLAKKLRERTGGNVEWIFQTMPVIWGASAVLDFSASDVVVHLGLGVYNNIYDQIHLEDGAFNGRAGKDVLGFESGSTIELGEEQHIFDARMSQILKEVAGENDAPKRNVTAGPLSNATFSREVVGARAANSYLCNEFHWRALRALRVPTTRLQGAFFLHLPRPARESLNVTSGNSTEVVLLEDKDTDMGAVADYGPLADATADVILGLVSRSLPDHVVVHPMSEPVNEQGTDQGSSSSSSSSSSPTKAMKEVESNRH